jgi:hypothetical protein
MMTATTSHISIPTQIAESAKLSASQIALMITRATLGAFAILMMIAALNPDIRSGLRASLLNDQRQVVSTAKGHLAGDSRMFTVAKVKTAGALSLEIFEVIGNGQEKLVEKIELADARDGYFDFNGHSSNLAIDDVNGDGRPEILAPTFDNNLVGHLNVYNLDPESNSIQKVIR